ncbi:MAG: hypothetical protein AAGI46_17180, partial [Planctomycetota bacterium]
MMHSTRPDQLQAKLNRRIATWVYWAAATTFGTVLAASSVEAQTEPIATVDCEKCDTCETCQICGEGEDPSDDPESFVFRFRIGQANFEDAAGGLYIHEEEPIEGLARPAAMMWLGSLNTTGLEVVSDPGDAAVIRQALTPRLLMDVVDNTTGGVEQTDVTLYWRPTSMPAKVGGVYPVTGLTAFRTVQLKELADDASNQVTKLLITWDPDADSMTTDEVRTAWEWVDLGPDGTGWKAGKGVNASGDFSTAIRIAQLITLDSGSGQYTETRTITEGSGTVISKVVETYETFAWGDELIKREDYPTVSAAEADRLTTTYTYYDDSANDGDNYTRIETMTDERG